MINLEQTKKEINTRMTISKLESYKYNNNKCNNVNDLMKAKINNAYVDEVIGKKKMKNAKKFEKRHQLLTLCHEFDANNIKQAYRNKVMLDDVEQCNNVNDLVDLCLHFDLSNSVARTLKKKEKTNNPAQTAQTDKTTKSSAQEPNSKKDQPLNTSLYDGLHNQGNND